MMAFTDSAAVATRRKMPLSKDEFEHICFEASRNSTNSADYLLEVLAKVCDCLGTDRAFVPSCSEAGQLNVQIIVATLYHLLDEEFQCDFDVPEVLNYYSEYMAETA